jgi:hypothetical protein
VAGYRTVNSFSESRNSVSKNSLKPLGRQGGMARRVLNIRCPRYAWIAHVSWPSSANYMSVWAWTLMPRSATATARSIMQEKPGADGGAPRSGDEHKMERRAFPLMPAELSHLRPLKGAWQTCRSWPYRRTGCPFFEIESWPTAEQQASQAGRSMVPRIFAGICRSRSSKANVLADRLAHPLAHPQRAAGPGL